jgi:hypothetical protein
MRLEKSHHHRAGFELTDLFHRQWRDRQQHIGLRQHRGLATGPFTFLVERVWKLGSCSGAGFEQYTRPGAGEFVDDLWHERDASFTGRALFERAYRDRHLS